MHAFEMWQLTPVLLVLGRSPQFDSIELTVPNNTIPESVRAMVYLTGERKSFDRQ